MNEAEVRVEVKELMVVLIHLGEYTRDDLIEIVDDAVESAS